MLTNLACACVNIFLKGVFGVFQKFRNFHIFWRFCDSIFYSYLCSRKAVLGTTTFGIRIEGRWPRRDCFAVQRWLSKRKTKSSLKDWIIRSCCAISCRTYWDAEDCHARPLGKAANISGIDSLLGGSPSSYCCSFSTPVCAENGMGNFRKFPIDGECGIGNHRCFSTSAWVWGKFR